MTQDNQDRAFVAFLKAQPRYETKRGWFPGMGQAPKPPRNRSQDNYLWKARDKS